jgi:phage gpG-like protein
MPGMSPVQINTTVWQRLQRALALNSKAAQESHVLVGVIAAKGGDAPAAEGGITMIELAAIHEFGSPEAGIPQRSFIRSTFNRSDVRNEMGQLAGKLVGKVIQGMKLQTALGLMGAWGVAQIKNTVNNRMTTGPENQALKPATIKAKGSDLPLVDTGRLLNAIQWLVKLGFNRDSGGRFTGGQIDL